MYPITIDKLSLRHRSGTKDYHLVLVANAAGHCLLFKRWGKASQWGQLQVEQYDNIYAGKSAFDKMRKTKEGRGYSNEIAHLSSEAKDEAELIKQLGAQYWNNAGAANLKFLLPDVDASGVRDPEVTEFDKLSDRFVPKDKKRRLIPDPEPTIEDKVRENPNWGIF